MSWIEPLELKTWIVDVLSGTPLIFTALALLVISSMAAYFRMTLGVMFFMIFLFILMFAEFTGEGILLLIAVIGGLVIGQIVSNMVKR